MTKQSVRIGTRDIVITPAEAEDGSFTATSRGQPEPAFTPDDWTDPRTRLNAARTICEAFSVTRNNQNLTKVSKVSKVIDDAMA